MGPRGLEPATVLIPAAGEILTGVLVRKFMCGRPVTTHLERKKSKADYRFSRALTQGEETEIESAVNEVCRRDLPVREEFLPRAVAGAEYDLTRLPELVGESVRIVHIGDFDACPCSGQHVGSTREVGEFRIVSTTFEEGILRVRFKLGSGSGDADRAGAEGE
jgi:misacylated tRNA(Ala) deacylase